MAGNPNFDTALLAATFGAFLSRQPKDAIFQGIPFWEEMHGKNRVKRKGGNVLYEPLLYAKSTSGGAYSGYDAFDLTPSEGLTRSEYAWKYYEWSLMISGQEEQENAGESQMVDLLETKWEQARMSIKDQLAQDIFLAGTAGNGKGLVGLALAVDNAGTYGNIDRTSNVWWKAVETAVSGPLTLAGVGGMRRIHNDCAYGQQTQTPDLIATTQILFEAYEALMDPYIRYSTSDNNTGLSTPNLRFRNSKITWDDYCQSGVMYFLNTSFLKIYVQENRDFVPTDWKVPTNQDAKVAQIYFAGNMVSSNCRHHGKLTGLSNT